MRRRKMKVTIKNHGYQRNGVGGEGFHYFEITWKDDDNKQRTGVATLTVINDIKGEYPERFNGSCRILTPDNLDDHWRGNVFEGEIRKQHSKWYN
jgi:hypothetical protein